MQKLQTLVLLLVAYAAATWIPGPGLYVRQWNLLGNLLGNRLGLSVNPPEVLLAGLLFSAGLCSTHGAVRTILANRRRLVASALAAWLVPLVAATVCVVCLWALAGCPPQVALGIVIVAAMPVANSSVGWATTMGGSVALSIALLVVGTALSPLLTPLAIGAGAITLRTAEHAFMHTPWSDGMGAFFLSWVLAPVLLGVVTASQLPARLLKHIVPWSRRASFVILIVLNYLNGAPCLPALAEQPGLLWWPVLAATCLLMLSFLASLAVSQWQRAAAGLAAPEPAERISMMLSIVMRNTGAALVFAGAALPEFVSVSLTIIAYTMLQHLWAGSFLTRRPPPEHTRHAQL